MPGASSSIVVDVPPKVIYDVVVDFGKYPQFLPDVKKAKVIQHGKHPTAAFEISVIKTIHYTLEFNLTPPKKVTWKLVDGDFFKGNHGSWEFEEIKKGQTKATYHVEVNFGLLVPSLITNKLVGNNLPKMMERFKERAEAGC